MRPAPDATARPKRNHRVAVVTNPTTTAWAVPVEAGPPRFTWPASKGRSRYRCWSRPGSGETAPSSQPCWKPRVPRVGLGRPRVRPLRGRGDKAYSSRANRAYLRRRGIRCTIPEPADQAGHRKRRGTVGGRPPAFDCEDYKARQRSRVRHQPTEAEPGSGHPVRQTRGPLRGHRPGRRDQRMAVTSLPVTRRRPTTNRNSGRSHVTFGGVGATTPTRSAPIRR